MSLASLSESLSSAVLGNRGTLEGIQEFFWASEPTTSRLALVIAEVEGPSTAEDWKNALGKVQQRYQSSQHGFVRYLEEDLTSSPRRQHPSRYVWRPIRKASASTN
jgi:hypothetical protein